MTVTGEGSSFRGFVTETGEAIHKFGDKSTIKAAAIDANHVQYSGMVTMKPDIVNYGPGNPKRLEEPLPDIAASAADKEPALWMQQTVQLSGGNHTVMQNSKLLIDTSDGGYVSVVGNVGKIPHLKFEEGATLALDFNLGPDSPLIIREGAVLELADRGTPVEIAGVLNELSQYLALGGDEITGYIVEFKDSKDSKDNGSKFTGKFREVNDLELIGRAEIKMPDLSKGETTVNMVVKRQQDIAGAIARFTNRTGVTNLPLTTQIKSALVLESPEKIKIHDDAYAKAKKKGASDEDARKAAALALDREGNPLNSRQQSVLASVKHALTEGANSVMKLADETAPQNVSNGANVRLSRTIVDAAHQNIIQRFDALLDGSMPGVAAGDGLESQGVWGNYIHVDGKQDNKDDIAGYDAKFDGITIGWDAELSSGVKPGFAFTYVKADVDTKDVNQSVKGDHYMGTFYAGWMDGPWLANGMLSYAQGKNDYKAQINEAGVMRTYKGDGDAKTWALTLAGGYAMPIDEQWTLQPKAELNYVNVKIDDYDLTNDNGGFSSKIATDNFDVIELGLGIRAVGDIPLDKGKLISEFRLMGYYDFNDKDYQGDYQLLSSSIPAHHLDGMKRERARGVAGLGVNYSANDNLSVGLNYDYYFQDGYTAHSVMVKFSYDF